MPRRPPMKEALTERWRIYCRNRIEGMNRADAYMAAGYECKTKRTAAVCAFQLERRPYAQEYLAELGHKAEVNPINVLRTLNRQMLGDIDACLDELGRFSIDQARELDMTSLIKSITYHKDSGQIEKVEMYCAQSAAKALLPVCGLEQQPRMNDEDSARIKQHIEAEVKRLMEKYEWDREKALEFVKEAVPASAKYLM
jgi:hypothetical protein